MNWLMLSLLASLLWAIVNIVDKIMVERFVKQPIIYALFTGIYASIPALFILAVFGISNISSTYIFFSMFSGFTLIIYTYLFYRALTLSDTPVVVALFLLAPVFSLLWGFLFFSETFTIQKYIGVCFIIGGAFFISLEISKKDITEKTQKTAVSPALFLMIVSCFFASVGSAIQKFLLVEIDPITVYFWGNVGALISVGLLLTIGSVRRNLLKTMVKIGIKINSVIIFNELLSLLAIFLVIKALSIGTLSLVVTATAVQPLYVLILVIIVNIIKKELIPDNKSKQFFLVRLALIGVMISGIYLIS